MWARRCFLLTAAVVAVGLVVQVFATARLTTGHFATPLGRVLNIVFFFTVESNIIVMVTAALLAVRLDRRSTTFAAFRMAGLVGITVTGIVYWSVLRGLVELSGGAYLADVLLHTVSPLLAVIGWVAFGPRRLASSQAVRLSVLFPLLYFVVTLVRGALIDWYPYPFVDVSAHGYPRVLVNAVVVAALFFGVAFGAAWLDRRIDRGDWVRLRQD